MKNKKLLIITVCVVLAAAFILGVTDTVNFRGGDIGASRGDMLIGMFITRQYLNTFDFDQYFEENMQKALAGGQISDGDLQKYGRVLWATLKEKQQPTVSGDTLIEREYIFEGVDGFRMIYPVDSGEGGPYGYLTADREISDAETSISADDTSETTKLNGVIYFVPKTDDEHFFFNHVYQTADGRVYAVAGDSISFSPENTAGSSMGMTFSGWRNETQYGKTTRETRMEASVQVKIVDKMKKVTVLQFGADNNLLKSEEFLPGQLPETYVPLAETEYIILDTENESEDPDFAHDREIFAKNTGFMYAFTCRDDGICTKQNCEILWPGKTSEQ